ncbi:MAG: hypothetical protein ACI8WT_003418 [Clostridium sp.]|jgi:hypothetical protein
MVKIKELLKIEPINSFQLLGDKSWLDNEINSIGILDYEAIEENYVAFRKGDLILTTLMFAKNDAQLAEKALIGLMMQGVSAIAIKSIYYNNFSEYVINYANDKRIQLFIFDNILFEDIIIVVYDEIRKKEKIKFYEMCVKRLFNEMLTKGEIRDILIEINSSFLCNSICLFCVEKEKRSSVKPLIPEIIKNMQTRKAKGVNCIYNSVFRYENGIILIHTYNSGEEYPFKKAKEILKNISLNSKDFIIGVSNIHKEFNDISKGIIECIYANRYCIQQKLPICEFKNIGIQQVLMPLANNYWLMTFSNSLIEPIKEFDEKTNSNLLLTAIKYIENNGELKKTSEDLFQHVNTIRYRLNKIKELVHCDEDSNDFYEELFIAINVYKLG